MDDNVKYMWDKKNKFAIDFNQQVTLGENKWSLIFSNARAW